MGLSFPFISADCVTANMDNYRGAALLNGPHAEKFVEQLWKATVEDLAKVNQELSRFA